MKIKEYIDSVANSYKNHLVTAGITLAGTALIQLCGAVVNLTTTYVQIRAAERIAERVMEPINQVSADVVEALVIFEDIAEEFSNASETIKGRISEPAESVKKAVSGKAPFKKFSAEEAKKMFRIGEVKKK